MLIAKRVRAFWRKGNIMGVALVLGGGGVVGVAWQSGVVHGLLEGDVDFSEVDAVIGTSAGSIAGALLCGGVDLGSEIVERLQECVKALMPGSGALGDGRRGEAGMALVSSLLDAMSAVDVDGPGDGIRRLGEKALLADVMPQTSYIDAFEKLVGRDWPARLLCAATEITSGEVRTLDASTGIPLSQAVAASAAIPTVFPPVWIEGTPYMDGGVIDSLNLDKAAGHDVIIAMSCFSLTADPNGRSQVPIGLDSARASSRALRESGGRLELIEPDAAFAALNQGGASAMNTDLMAEAHSVGQRWGRSCAPRIRSALAR